MDRLKILSNFSFGRVDAETDDKLVNCFIGTDLLKYALSPQHTLLLGGKGSGKSAIFKILSQEADRLNPFISFSFNELFRIPAYGLNSDEYLTYPEIKEINPQTIEDFKYFWQLYFSLKSSFSIVTSNYLNSVLSKSNSCDLRLYYKFLLKLLDDIGLLKKHQQKSKSVLEFIKRLLKTNKLSTDYNTQFRRNLNVNLILDKIDKILKITNSYLWILVDQIDLLYLDDLNKRNKAITALIQLIIEYSNRFSNINFKIFLRSDIYKELNIINKSHLVSNSIELIWTEDLILRLILARAIFDRSVKQYCEEKLNESIDINKVITGNYNFLLKLFYTIFQNKTSDGYSNLHKWIIRKLTDGLGKIYPREFIHLANLAVAVQKELYKTKLQDGNYLISEKAVKAAFKSVSKYRCETFLYSEFPHLTKHLNRISAFGYDRIKKEEMFKLFEDCEPSGLDAVRAFYDAGLFKKSSTKSIDNANEYIIPDLYRYGLGLTIRKAK